MENINLEWFFKLPGLFITGGIFLILIAIVVYLIGSSKEKKALKEESNYGVDSDNMKVEAPNEEVVTPLVNPNVVTEPVKSEVNTIGGQPVNVVGTNEKVEETPVASFNPVITPVTPVNESVEVNPVTPVSLEEKDPSKEEVKVVETPSITPIITPIEPVNTVESVNKPSEVTPVEINVVTPDVNVIPPIVQDKVADEVKKVEVNVTPLVEVTPQVSEPVVNNVPEQVQTTPNETVKEEIKIEPVVVTPVVEPTVPLSEEVKVASPNEQNVQEKVKVATEDTIEEI